MYPIPKIQYLLLRLEGFWYGTTLDLNIVYCHIELSAKYKELCTIVTQWVKYKYQQLPMGLCSSPNILQEKMSELFVGLHRTCLRRWPLSCHKRLLEIKFYCPLRYVCPPTEGLAQSQRRQFMIWRPQIWIIGLSHHLWRGYAHTKESRCHSSLCSPKDTQKLRQFIGMINFYRDM